MFTGENFVYWIQLLCKFHTMFSTDVLISIHNWVQRLTVVQNELYFWVHITIHKTLCIWFFKGVRFYIYKCYMCNFVSWGTISIFGKSNISQGPDVKNVSFNDKIIPCSTWIYRFVKRIFLTQVPVRYL